jgi:RNA polymerase sigma-70 factor (ECF subfamily)
MYSILRRQYGKTIRRAVRERVIPQQQAADWRQLAAPSDENAAVDLPSRLTEALHQLEDRFKLPLLLVSMEGLSIDEAAGALGVPRGTVLSRLHRARQKIKSMLEPVSEQNGRAATGELPTTDRTTAAP